MIDKEQHEVLPNSVRNPYMTRRLPTLFSIVFVGIAWALNEIALAWIHERVPRDISPLPDLWFSWFPEVRGAIRITEYIMMILVINALFIIATHQHRWVVSRRVFLCAALSYCFRAFCITVFQVPVPSIHTYCAPKTNGSWYVVSARVARMFWSAGIEQLRPRELCGDLIVSGHTITIFTAFYTFKYYSPKKLKPLSGVLSILSVVAVTAILFSRKHYTIDVVLGYVKICDSSHVFNSNGSIIQGVHNF
uniref:PAP2_C domain-containing protein n=1 Tax=Angiostrongylus cantonensis TaxID=6313 RepID=A0A0K0CT18_ANGCA